MLRWTLEKKELPLKFLWRISRGALETKLTYFIKLHEGFSSVSLGEVSPNTRYHNTPEVIESQFKVFLNAAKQEKKLPQFSLAQFETWLESLNLCNTLRFGIESAWIHRLSKLQNKPVSHVLGLPQTASVTTSFSVPIMDTQDPRQLEEFVLPLKRFETLKIKVNAETGTETLRIISRLTPQRLRIDANEAWSDPDDFLRFTESLKGMNIEFIEQPFPEHLKAEYRELRKRSPYLLIGDESIEKTADFEDLKTQFHGVNVKLMKTGGLLRASELLQEARQHQMRTMIGCMVETSLGIFSALHLCALADYVDLDGFLLLKEDPFHFVHEEHGKLSFTSEHP